MRVDIYINFNGNCHEAISAYSKIFNTEIAEIRYFKDMPSNPEYKICPEDANKVMHSRIQLGNIDLMCSDVMSHDQAHFGNHITLSVSDTDLERLTEVFNGLAVNGNIELPLQKTFFSDAYGIVEDAFKIRWQVMHSKV